MKRKVLHVIDSLDLGGAQTFLLDLVKHHDSFRYLPEVAAMHGRGVYAPAFEEAGIPTHSLSPGKFPPLYVPNFLRLMREGRYDILHFHLFGANLCVKPLAILAGHRGIIVHDQCNDASRDQSPALLAADALANRGVSRVIAVSESVRRYLMAHEDLAESKVEMIPNGIDALMFSPANEVEHAGARKNWGIPAKAFVVGGVGRLVAQKNFGVFLRVAAQILSRHPGVIFVIAGTGPLEEKLRDQADALGISANIRFLGHVSDRVRLYQALDALLMTSDFEGTPMTLLEAMASGLPVVASSVDGIAEVCTDGHDALLAPPRDVEKFTTALDKVIQGGGLRLQLGAKARETILERYEISGLTRKIEAIYDEVLSEQAAS
jgi:glycosyltransferase involved in cell wall biosynthesis